MMKNQKLNALLLLILFGMSLSLGSCSKDKIEPEDNDDPTAEVVFEDASLAAFIKEELAIGDNDKITKADLAELTSLNIRGALTGVTSLKGLEHATELTLLDFGGNVDIKDLTPIKDLKKITYLRMNETGVTSLAPISEYTTLTYFNANQASPGISDLSPLSKNTGLQTMILRAQPLDNAAFQAISGFTRLYRLNIRDTELTDLSVIAELIGKGAFLKSTPGSGDLGSDPTLDLRGLSITNCEVLDPHREDLAGAVEGACAAPAGPTGPTSINMPDAALVAHVRARLGLAEGVALDSENIKALTTIESTGTFQTAGFTDIADLTGLEYAINLEKIHLGETKITSIAALGNLKKVTYLRFNDTGVTSLSPVSEYTTLTYFNFNTPASGTVGISDLSPLSNNVNMEEMILRAQPITSLSAIANFKKLARLNIRDTQVTSVSVLVSLMSGTEPAPISTLDLRGLTLSDCISSSWASQYASQISSYNGPQHCN